MAFLPKLKKEKKYWYVLAGAHTRDQALVSYLVDGIRLIVVDDADLASICKLHHLGFLNVKDILDRNRNLDAVSIVVRAEDDSL